jgi:hypothetical protein
MYVGSIFVPANMTIIGIQFLHGTAVPGAQRCMVALYSAAGALVANSTTAGTTLSGAASVTQRIAFTASYAAKGPAWYFIGMTFDTATANLFAVVPLNADAGNGVVGTIVTGLVFGTLPSSITPPATFQGAGIPIASPY